MPNFVKKNFDTFLSGRESFTSRSAEVIIVLVFLQ